MVGSSNLPSATSFRQRVRLGYNEEPGEREAAGPQALCELGSAPARSRSAADAEPTRRPSGVTTHAGAHDDRGVQLSWPRSRRPRRSDRPARSRRPRRRSSQRRKYMRGVSRQKRWQPELGTGGRKSHPSGCDRAAPRCARRHFAPLSPIAPGDAGRRSRARPRPLPGRRRTASGRCRRARTRHRRGTAHRRVATSGGASRDAVAAMLLPPSRTVACQPTPHAG